MTDTQLAVFKGKKIRRHWDEKSETWFFSVVDIVGILTGSPNPRSYWKVLKNRLKKEGSEVVTKCNHLKMQAADGKYYKTDAADTEAIFRIIQSIPSPKAEPFKRWLAKVGYDRVQEIENPELAAQFAAEFGNGEWAYLAGLWHVHRSRFVGNVGKRSFFS